jgi:hypothetical protein
LAGLNLLFTDFEIEGMFTALDSHGKGHFNYEDFAKMKGDTRFSLNQRSGSMPQAATIHEDGRTATASSVRSRFYFGPKRFQKIVLPSDVNPSFSYGVASQPTDNIQDVLQHNFAKEYLTKLTQINSKAESIAPTRRVKRGTVASVKRAGYIREMYSLDQKVAKPHWKLSRFSRVLPRLTGNRIEDFKSQVGAEELLNQTTKL